MFFDALGGCPRQALVKQGQVDAVLLSLFQSRRQFRVSFHAAILALRRQKQKAPTSFEIGAFEVKSGSVHKREPM